MSERELSELTDRELMVLSVRLQTAILEQLIELNEAAAPEETDECEHPEEKRVSIATPGDVNHWVCAVCKFDNKAQTMN